ncbi:hypothetical protein BKA61DRAFT_52399 [Leptodontidium sp. MPI-SDFR-AT-0119]|nr:hypothetical protein BKA61DRAFT_52399 [Leptodontidium sp. MPI-SDFR-AT-0119]
MQASNRGESRERLFCRRQGGFLRFPSTSLPAAPLGIPPDKPDEERHPGSAFLASPRLQATCAHSHLSPIAERRYNALLLCERNWCGGLAGWLAGWVSGCDDSYCMVWRVPAPFPPFPFPFPSSGSCKGRGGRGGCRGMQVGLAGILHTR